MGRGTLPLGMVHPVGHAGEAGTDGQRDGRLAETERRVFQPPRNVAVPPPSRRGLSRVESAEYIGVSPRRSLTSL